MNVQQHLLERRVETKLYLGASVDEREGVAVFPLWGLNGALLGFQQYRPFAGKTSLPKNPSSQRYFTVLSKQLRSPVPTAFGVDLLNRRSQVVFLAEGIFDVAPLHNMGANALATLSNNPGHLRGWLRALGYHLVALCEGDKAGKKLASVAHEKVDLPDGEDPGSLPDEWFVDLLKQYKG